MHKALRIVLWLAILSLLFNGLMFMMASDGVDMNLAIGIVSILIAVGLIAYIAFLGRLESRKPVTIKHEVALGPSGEMKGKEIRCRTCSAPLTDKDIKMVDGGIMCTCPYCGVVTTLEEEPKW